MANFESIYYNPTSSGSYGGINKLVKAGDFNLKDAKRWLTEQDAYTLHKPIRRKFRRNKYILRGIDDLWQADLADLTHLSRHNNGIKYLIVIIDTFSKFLWVLPVKNKTADTVDKAVANLLKERRPKHFMTDKGTEFAKLKQSLTKLGINFYTTQNPDTKASIAERVIRTIKGRIYRYLTHKNTQRYIDDLDKIVKGYNAAKHRTIGMTPKNVTKANEDEIKARLYPPVLPPVIKFKYAVGDQVRIVKERGVFHKGYRQNWSEEIFTIHERLPRAPPVYKIKDYSGEVIEGTFYEPELQAVRKRDDVYKVEKILATRKKGKEVLVKWLGYPASMASWQPAANIIDK